MTSLRPFQIILLAVFAALAAGGLILFGVFRGFSGEENPYGASVQIWGTLDSQVFSAAIAAENEEDDRFRVVEYVEKDPRSFHNELVNAVAEGRGPDAIVVSSDLLLSERAKLLPIPYDAFPLRDIKDTYIEGAEIFALADGMYAFPFAVDPLVMYWNRSLFSSAGFAAPPATWEALLSETVPRLTRLGTDQHYAVDQAAVAFGEYGNVENATDVLLMLFLQAGSRLIEENAGEYMVLLNQASGETPRPPADAALDFYTQFANPARPVYTWNRSLPTDRSAFLAEDLALYFGFGSEYRSLAAGNANLNFDMAQIPQGSSGGSGVAVKKGYGTFYGFSILRSSDNQGGTYLALAKLAASARAREIAEGLGFAPAHRETIALGNSDPFRQAMYAAALVARGFLNPNPLGTENVMKTMIEDVTSGRASVSAAMGDADSRLNELVSQ